MKKLLESLLLIVILICTMQMSCKKPKEIPSITTAAATNITSTTFTSGGEIKSDGGAITNRVGVCYSRNQNPIISDSITIDVPISNVFTSVITGLSPGVTYYVRAYAINAVGIAYGNQVSAITPAVLPAITTSAITSVNAPTAVCGGNINNDGGSSIISRGVCWNTVTNPTIEDGKTTDGTGLGSFVSTITGLSPGTKYYVRAYATNSVGTVYGNVVSITLPAILPTVSTAVSSITAGSALCTGDITNDGGSIILDRGFCFSTTQNPTSTISGPNIYPGTGEGTFTSSIPADETLLNPGTTYYVRAYARNSVGTAYGNQVIFTTLAIRPTVTTSIVLNITAISAVCGGNITNNGGGTITDSGIYWGTNANPSTFGNKTSNVTGAVPYTISLTGLISGSTYYVCAYATNSAGNSYGSILTFKPQQQGSSATLADIDGNIYHTVAIGSQIWMVENLQTTKYQNGDSIPYVTNNLQWFNLLTGAYCKYGNATYGLLYNWYAMNDSRNLCPTGWHIPEATEWVDLTNYLGGANNAGLKLKESGTKHWSPPNTGATNESGFTGLPGGLRDTSGNFYSWGNLGGWWISGKLGAHEGRDLWYDLQVLDDSNYDPEVGLSVRCIKD